MGGPFSPSPNPSNTSFIAGSLGDCSTAYNWIIFFPNISSKHNQSIINRNWSFLPLTRNRTTPYMSGVGPMLHQGGYWIHVHGFRWYMYIVRAVGALRLCWPQEIWTNFNKNKYLGWLDRFISDFNYNGWYSDSVSLRLSRGAILSFSMLTLCHLQTLPYSCTLYHSMQTWWRQNDHRTRGGFTAVVLWGEMGGSKDTLVVQEDMEHVSS